MISFFSCWIPGAAQAASSAAPRSNHVLTWPFSVADIGPLDALVRITTSIGGTDIHVLRGEYPVQRKRQLTTTFPGSHVTTRLPIDTVGDGKNERDVVRGS